jgi:hypothetical protein
MSRVPAPLPQAIPVSSGPYDSVRAPSQMTRFPTVLQVSNDGGGLSV